ncbi:putative Long-chain-fatty-acid--luciferin-component ligase [Xenorhabdus bovienii str. Jollieti]|uniref:Putative Long-chain-fatty-acid--luciferin-component ligase n=1 Tax=Xenorhabdus bovienii (strain SS-2004) TaxID=406818 RepID=D3UWE5_XENBS|nr:acyl-protein synthase [Xenorhabdus bovienii]CBJ79719.1 putative Long-chain-fatty-acid--luciferin-component ligase [Xenorhabdus bovienii SS-2004]CDH28947.1 putative Long-chain-fatty-acid--luciferin-component ligase [Xenorhabdus bovienii str. Jollieti]
MTSLAYVDALCSLDHPYRADSDCDQLFDAAMRELTQYHCENSPGYYQWLKANGLDAQKLEKLHDWSHLPPIFANYFKHQLLLSHTGIDALELTSSGTTGQKSRMRYDTRSIQAAQRMVERIFEYYGWNTPQQPCNYILLSYEPAGAITLGTAYTDQYLCQYAPVSQACYALRHNGKSNEFDPFGVIRALQEFAAQGLPVRFLGFPAFLWFTLERMREMNLPPLQLHPESLVFLGGGWKTHADKAISRSELYRRLHEQLGIPDERCRDGYGSVEHPVPYVECQNHHFHVPSYARAYVRDTASMAVQPYGKPGFLHLISPYITSSPAHSIVVSDLAVLHPAAECGCGLATDWFELLGRAGISKNRSCAIAASELIKES